MIKFCSSVLPDMDRVAFYLKESFEKNQLSNFGPATQLLTERLKVFLELSKDRDLLLVSSGHTALMAAYACLDIDSIAIPSYTFKSTEVAATIQGLPVTHLNVDSDTGCLDRIPDNLTSKICKDNKGIVAVCALSTIPDFYLLEENAKIQNLKLIIDGAASFGTPKVYECGDAFCLSFHATKTFPIGEGGALIASPEVITKAKQYINFGFDKDRNPVRVGMNAKISEYTAAIGLALLEKMPDAIDKRNHNRDMYLDELGEFIPTSFSLKTTYQTIPLFIKNDFDRARKIRFKLREAKVEILQYYRPLISTHPITDMLYQTNICLPCHQDLTEEEIRFICKIVKST